MNRQEAERTVLGAILAGLVNIKVLRPSHFRSDFHREVFEAMVRANVKYDACDPIVVSCEMKSYKDAPRALLDLMELIPAEEAMEGPDNLSDLVDWLRKARQ